MMKALEVDEQAQKVELKSVKQNWQYNIVGDEQKKNNMWTDEKD